MLHIVFTYHKVPPSSHTLQNIQNWSNVATTRYCKPNRVDFFALRNPPTDTLPVKVKQMQMDLFLCTHGHSTQYCHCHLLFVIREVKNLDTYMLKTANKHSTNICVWLKIPLFASHEFLSFQVSTIIFFSVIAWMNKEQRI